MLKSYIKTVFRNLVRHKAYSIIEIFSLTVGLISGILILLWVIDEMSFDKFHTNAGSIYRVMNNNTYPDGRIETHGATSALLKEAIQSEIPEVAAIVQLSMETEILVRHEINA